MIKSYFILLIFLLSASSFSQINLSVHLKRSQSQYDISFIVGTLKIIKGDLLYREIPNPDSFSLYENVSNGEYKFCYKNLFGEKTERFVSLREANNILGGQDINLYIDELQNSKANNLFIENLKNDEMLKINLKFSGCFDNGEDSIYVFKKNNLFYVKYKKKKRMLKKIDIEAIVKYETELRSLPEVNFISTSNGFNQISLNGELFSYEEPSLFWGGYEILKKKLKLK